MTDAEWGRWTHVAPRTVTCSHVENLSEELSTDQTPKTLSPYSGLYVTQGWKINRHAGAMAAGELGSLAAGEASRCLGVGRRWQAESCQFEK